MISVEAALARIFALTDLIDSEKIALEHAAGRVLRAPVMAQRDQPPFAASAMDGYAVQDPVHIGQTLRVIGEAGAGHGFRATCAAGQAVRIFTGAPVPEGATRVVIQENTIRSGDQITLTDGALQGRNIRPKAADFKAGDQLSAPRRLRPFDLALIAAMNCPQLRVSKRPDVAIIATGDELVMPGETPRADQVIASNAYAIKAIAEAEGARARILPIARDTRDILQATLALAADADVIVTIGGASVGDHDLVAPVLQDMGAELSFHKVAMRPGKPLMSGKLGRGLMLGLPGNPVSSLVCAHLFLRPALRAMQGLGAWPLPTASATLAQDIGPNGPRTHYMRARLLPDQQIAPFDKQDSSLLGILTQADALLIQPANDPGQKAGATLRYVLL